MKKILVLFLSVLFFNCGKDDHAQTSNDSFDKGAMLAHWANNIILPSYEDYVTKTKALKLETEKFVSTPSQSNLVGLRTAWKNAYISFQYVGMFDFGKAYEIQFKNFSNIYPSNITGIESNISSGTYDLTLISQIDKQGFPALDYLLFGVADSDDKILEYYTTNSLSSSYKKYLSDVSNRLNFLSEQMLSHWKSGYKDAYIANTGNTVTSSVNITVNAYIRYFEKDIRLGKIGYPSGIFSVETRPNEVEAYFSKNNSLELLQASIKAMSNFFVGKSFNEEKVGLSLALYLDFLNLHGKTNSLTKTITGYFTLINEKSNVLNSNLSQQINVDKSKMLELYDEIHKQVGYLKSDMASLLNIAIDYVDADGD